MMKQVCETLEKKVAMKMLADCPAIILEMEEDRLMKMMLVKSKRDSFIEGKLQRSKQNSSFPCK
jgi:hypothetical protein